MQVAEEGEVRERPLTTAVGGREDRVVPVI